MDASLGLAMRLSVRERGGQRRQWWERRRRWEEEER
jgi:hypothetical protein